MMHDIEDIHDIGPLSAVDKDCLEEVRQVLERYGLTQRFGVTLLHTHFPIGSDEYLAEVSDAAARFTVHQPMRKSELEMSENIDTTWRFIDGRLEPIAGYASSKVWDSEKKQMVTKHVTVADTIKEK